MMHSIWMNMLLSCALTAPLWAAPLTKADEIKSLDQHISAQYVSCPTGQVVDKASNTCVWCPAGKIGTGLGQFPFDCVPCDADKYRPAIQGTQCMKCPAGEVPNRDHSGCQKCVEGFEPNNAGNNPDELFKTYDSICVACKEGSVKPFGQPFCSACTDQQVSNFARNECKTCPQGFEASWDNTHCTVCPGNKFRHGDWKLGCQVCDPAYDANPFGWVPTEDHGFCESCAAGFESNLGKKLWTGNTGIGDDCVPCEATKFRKAGHLGGCEFCPPGQSPSLGQDYCQ